MHVWLYAFYKHFLVCLLFVWSNNLDYTFVLVCGRVCFYDSPCICVHTACCMRKYEMILGVVIRLSISLNVAVCMWIQGCNLCTYASMYEVAAV